MGGVEGMDVESSGQGQTLSSSTYWLCSRQGSLNPCDHPHP